MPTPIVIAYGNGNGPDILEAVLIILREVAADITLESVEIGKRIYDMGGISGILPSSLDVLKRVRCLLKAPTAVPPEGYEDVSQAILRTMDVDASSEQHYYAYVDEGKLHISNAPNATDTCRELGRCKAFIAEHFSLYEPDGDEPNVYSMLLATVILLNHIGAYQTTDLILNAWQLAIADGVHEQNLYEDEFAEEILSRIGRKPLLQTVINIQ
ncbi:MAG: hypothetical protein SFT92_09230 [Rickettsiales bacterium]|nr:hypothetical protein [Rickettsiales bacterium]